MKKWYVLYTKPHAEYRVEEALALRKIETYLPEIESPQLNRKRKRVPFFPCYLFMCVDLTEVSGTQLQWLPGLRRLISLEDRPVPVPNNAIDLIRENLEKINAGGGLPEHPFKPGDVVRITSGPLADMLAVFEGPTTPAERVRLLLHFLGRVNKVELDVKALEKAPRDAALPMPKRPRRTRGRGRYIQ